MQEMPPPTPTPTATPARVRGIARWAGTCAALCALLVLATGCTSATSEASTDTEPSTGTSVADDTSVTVDTSVIEAVPPVQIADPVAMNRRLSHTINIGAVLELDRGEFPWGPELDDEDFAEFAAAGFTAVRLPVRFSAWAGDAPPYLIDDELWSRVDEAVDAALANDLAIIIDLHHYVEIFEDPERHRDRLEAMWVQIADRYQSLPTDAVAYEFLNEPNTNLDAATWNSIVADVLAAVRAIDPDRTVIVGPVTWNSHLEVPTLELPDDDNLILTFHYYDPFEFTHQGAEWLPQMAQHLGTEWQSDVDGAGARIDADFRVVAEWASARDLPVFVGEFGVLLTADQADRAAWVRSVREAAEREGFSWGHWDWASPTFGMQNDETGEWDPSMLDALFD